ncbi:hypothetical protein NIES4102_32220 [Chondrocystis sp. NIES-4102]|nr:hypothetical protein NIES4102_32220 [Chondrocystis sp. NIES-4102]
MNPVNLPVFILFLAAIYLLCIYGLLKIAEMQKPGSTIVSNTSKQRRNKIQTP